MKILLDYVFPISVITPTPAASTAFLKQVCLVAKPKAGQEANVGEIYECSSMTAVGVRTDNLEAQQFFNAGMNKVFILLSDDLALTEALDANPGEFHTLIISSDYDEDDVEATAAALVKAQLTFTAVTPGAGGNDISVALITGGVAGSEVVTVVGKAISVSMSSGVSTTTQIKAALDGSPAAAALISTAIASGQGATAVVAFALDNLEDGDGYEIGTFKGVVGISSSDLDFLEEWCATENQCGFFRLDANGAKNLCYAFGSLLANVSSWLNQQYITMPFDDEVETLGDAVSMFDEKISFVISDEEFGKRLALLAVGGKAIVAPYILKNVRIDIQSRALQWISANQPQYTLKEATLLETRLQEDVVNAYIARGEVESGEVAITLDEDNFVATGDIEIPQPKALWRVVSEMRETV